MLTKTGSWSRNLGVVLFFFAVIAVSNVAASTSKKILVEAISTSESLSNNLTVETRLKRYEKIASLVDKIISDHADSDEAIALVSGEKIGNFDYRDIKKRHFEEMKNISVQFVRLRRPFNVSH